MPTDGDADVRPRGADRGIPDYVGGGAGAHVRSSLPRQGAHNTHHPDVPDHPQGADAGWVAEGRVILGLVA